MALGTDTFAPVDMLVGPGNAYVAEAKRQVFGDVGIDMVAGPSEILVIGDGSTPADWVAMDLFSQAEHDESAQAILLSPEESYLDAVAASIDKLLPGMERKAVISASLKNRGALGCRNKGVQWQARKVVAWKKPFSCQISIGVEI